MFFSFDKELHLRLGPVIRRLDRAIHWINHDVWANLRRANGLSGETTSNRFALESVKIKKLKKKKEKNTPAKPAFELG